VTIVDFQDARILDAVQIEEIGKELFRLVDDMDRKKLVLDFSKVRFLSSSTIGVLISLRKKTADIDGTLVICGLRSELMEIFKIMKIQKLFTFCADEQKAMHVFGFPMSGG
jgi:anti-sigma B factor antagonist